MILGYIALWFIALSLLCFGLMFLDKRAAVQGRWRVPERTLLLGAYLGGGVGAKLAQSRFRHKTQKEPFRTLLTLSLVANGLLLVTLAIPNARNAVLNILLQAL